MIPAARYASTFACRWRGSVVLSAPLLSLRDREMGIGPRPVPGSLRGWVLSCRYAVPQDHHHRVRVLPVRARVEAAQGGEANDLPELQERLLGQAEAGAGEVTRFTVGDASPTVRPSREALASPQRGSGMRLASFFTGIGGFDLGFENAGAKVVFQCEIDLHCQQVLRKHWPDAPLHGDITTLEAKEIPDADIWSAGWPCQDISNGNSQRAGINGSRSGLFFRFIDLAREVRPRWIILENVPGLLSSDRGSALESVIDEMEEIGYLGGWTTCNTLDFGLPQNRERIVIVASLGTDRAYNVLAHGSRLRGDHQARGEQRKGSLAEVEGGTGGHNPVVVQRRGGFGYTKGAGICPTLRAQTGKHQGGHSDRPILCGEKLDLERMRATDGVSGRLDGRRGRLIGNAVAVPLAQYFASQIILADKGRLPPCD